MRYKLYHTRDIIDSNFNFYVESDGDVIIYKEYKDALDRALDKGVFYRGIRAELDVSLDKLNSMRKQSVVRTSREMCIVREDSELFNIDLLYTLAEYEEIADEHGDIVYDDIISKFDKIKL